MNLQGTTPKQVSRDRYTAIRPVLDTFDIINCEHRNLFLRMIGHTAMVYKEPQTGQISVYESTSLSWTGIDGVQLTPMSLWLSRYPGKVKIRRLFLDGKPYCSDVIKVSRSLWLAKQHILKYRGVPYPDLKDPKQRDFLLNAAIDLPLGIGRNIDRHDIMFCTQLVGDDYQFCGLYTGDEPPSELEPDDTRPDGKFEGMLAPGLTLGNEIRIK